MKLKKRLLTFFLFLLLFGSMQITVYAHQVPDPDKRGSVNITMRYGNDIVAGGSMTLYHAGAIAEDDGNYSFLFTDSFSGCKESLTDVSSASLAEALAKYVKDHNISGTAKDIGKDGKISFSGLEPGLYLLIQHQAADGYNEAAPFLVSVPLYENGIYIYDVDASPKVDLIRKPDGNDDPDDNDDSDDNDQDASGSDEPVSAASSPKTDGGILPQTGQLNWPIPVLALSGLCLFSIGWILRFGRKSNQHEK